MGVRRGQVIANAIPPFRPYVPAAQYSDMWTRSIQSFSFDVVLTHWLQTGELLSAQAAGQAMGGRRRSLAEVDLIGVLVGPLTTSDDVRRALSLSCLSQARMERPLQADDRCGAPFAISTSQAAANEVGRVLYRAAQRTTCTAW